MPVPPASPVVSVSTNSARSSSKSSSSGSPLSVVNARRSDVARPGLREPARQRLGLTDDDERTRRRWIRAHRRRHPRPARPVQPFEARPQAPARPVPTAGSTPSPENSVGMARMPIPGFSLAETSAGRGRGGSVTRPPCESHHGPCAMHQARIELRSDWIPAFAGMTKG